MNLISRYLTEHIRAEALALGKMAFLSGPRQTGKTTIGRLLLEHPENEFTWDDEDFRKSWIRSPAQAIAAREAGPILLDEIYQGSPVEAEVQGAVGHLPAGLSHRRDGQRAAGRLSQGGGQPAGPVSAVSRPPVHRRVPGAAFWGSEARARRWSRLRRARLIAKDVRDLRNIQNLRALDLLVDLLPSRVGSLLSVNSLRQDLQVVHDTIAAWLDTLAAERKTPLNYQLVTRPGFRKNYPDAGVTVRQGG